MILRMTEAHLCAVAELESEIFAEPWSAASLRLLTSDAAVGYVYTEGERVLAYGGMLYAPYEGQITNIAVRPEARRQGLARKILSALLQDAAAHGAESVSLEVRASNEAAQALYRSFGFTVAGVRRNFYRAPAEDAFVMLKWIKDD